MDPILGSIALFGFGFVPQGWAACDGSLLSISQNSALYTLLGTTYGGDGSSTFALPNLQGRVAVNQGQSKSSYVLGAMDGNESVILTTGQMPAHNHTLTGSTNAATTGSPAGSILASSNGSLEDGTSVSVNTYGPSSTANTSLDPSSIGMAGSSQPVPVMPPYLVLNYCIAITGVFPVRS